MPTQCHRCVHDQERLAERAYSICQAVLLGVRDETAPNAELAPASITCASPLSRISPMSCRSC